MTTHQETTNNLSLGIKKESKDRKSEKVTLVVLPKILRARGAEHQHFTVCYTALDQVWVLSRSHDSAASSLGQFESIGEQTSLNTSAHVPPMTGCRLGPRLAPRTRAFPSYPEGAELTFETVLEVSALSFCLGSAGCLVDCGRQMWLWPSSRSVQGSQMNVRQPSIE